MPWIYLVEVAVVATVVPRYIGARGGWVYNKSGAYPFETRDAAEARAFEVVAKDPAKFMGKVRVVRYSENERT